MKINEKVELLKFSIKINLIIGIYNLFLFSYGNTIFNLVIGSINIGVWVFFRDMKLVNTLMSKKINSKEFQ